MTEVTTQPTVPAPLHTLVTIPFVFILGRASLHPDHRSRHLRIRGRRILSSVRRRTRDEDLHPELIRWSVRRKGLEPSLDGLAGLHAPQRHRVLDPDDGGLSPEGKNHDPKEKWLLLQNNDWIRSKSLVNILPSCRLHTMLTHAVTFNATIRDFQRIFLTLPRPGRGGKPSIFFLPFSTMYF